MPGGDAVLTDMRGQQLVCPQLVGIAEFLGLLASAMLHPDHRIVRQLPRPPRSGQLSQRCVKPKLQTLADAQHHRATTDVMALCDRLIALSRERSQQDRRAQSPPPLFGSGPTDGLQFTQILCAELQGIPLPWEGHASLKHNPPKMYIYLENDNLHYNQAGAEVGNGAGRRATRHLGRTA